MYLLFKVTNVHEIQEGWQTFETGHLLYLASNTNSPWEFKACLNLLAERGDIDWYANWIHKQLNKWQSVVQLSLDPEWHRTHVTDSDEMVQEAFLHIYRITGDFEDLKSKNSEASYAKK